MRINKYILMLSGVLVLNLLSACGKKFLDLKPYVSVPAADALKTTDDLNNAMRGVYSDLRQVDLYGRTLPVFGDLLGDNIYLSTRNSGRYVAQSTWNVTSSDDFVQGFWDDAYNTVLGANLIIDAVTNNATLASDPAALECKAEALSVRALMYFELVRYFGTPYTIDPAKPGVPLVLHYDINAKPARNTVAEVYTQVLKDLDDAYTMYGDYKGSAYFSKYAARALAAKISLYTKKYDQALTYAKDVINNSGFTLVRLSDYNSYWENVVPHTASNKTETLFEISTDAVNNNGADELANIFLQSRYGDLLASQDLYDTYSATDVRRSLIISGVRDNVSVLVVNKYQHEDGDRDDKKVLRLSEVYLVAAEAAHFSATPDDVAAVNYLNTLAAQRDPSLTFVAGTTITNDILAERRRELAFEGDRFNDLNRFNLPINSPSTGSVIPAGDSRRLLPIPQQTLDANNNIMPNP